MSLTPTQRAFLEDIVRGEEEYGLGCYGAPSRPGSQTVPSLLQRGLVEYLAQVECEDGLMRAGYTLTDAGREFVQLDNAS